MMHAGRRYGYMEYKSFSATASITLNYLVYLPQKYVHKATWPLIMFLHGAGERGNTLEELDRLKRNGLMKYLKTDPKFADFPFVVVAPQCPTSTYWPVLTESLDCLIDEILDKYNIDTAKIYLTGLSMGGYGTWYLGYHHPERFAAMAPVCGSGIPSSADRLIDMPIWVFHGMEDPIVPYSHSEFLYRSIKAAGGNIRLTGYPGVGHDSWTKAYANKELYSWFLEQGKR